MVNFSKMEFYRAPISKAKTTPGAVLVEYEAIVRPIGRSGSVDIRREIHFFDPHIKTTIWRIKNQGYRFGVFSRKDYSLLWDVLRAHSLWDLATYVGGANEIPPKTIEQQILEGAKDLGVKPSGISVVCALADSIKQARKAGAGYIIAVGYAGRSKVEELEKAKPSGIAQSVEQQYHLLGLQNATER